MIDKNKIAGMNIHFIRYPFTSFLESVSSCGLQNIEVWGGAPHLMVDWETRATVLSLKKEIRHRKLSVVCFTPEQCKYPISLSIQDKIMRNYSINYFKKSIDIASDLEASKIVITSSFGYENYSLYEARELCINSISILSDYAKTRGVDLCLEVQSIRTSNILNNSVQASKMIEDIGATNVFGMIDFCQMAESDETPNDYFQNFGHKQIKHIHIIDGTPIGHKVLGAGNFPIKKWCEDIQNCGYDGYWSLEICDPECFHNPDEALEKSIDYLLGM